MTTWKGFLIVGQSAVSVPNPRSFGWPPALQPIDAP